MTEQLHHTPSHTERKTVNNTAELEAMYALEYDQPDIDTATTPDRKEVREVSPLATRVRNAAERFANLLEKRSMNRAHDAALKEYRDRDMHGYSSLVDSLSRSDEAYAADYVRLQKKEDRIASREEFVEAGKEKLKDLGYIALGAGVLGFEKASGAAKDAGLIGIGLGVMGYEATSKAVGSRVETAKFRHEMNRDERTSKRTTKKELKQFDKQAKRELKQTHKTIKAETKAAIQQDKAFDRDLHREATVEKWENRVDKVESAIRGKKDAAVEKVAKGARRTGEAYRNTKEKAEAIKGSAIEKKRKIGGFALRARAAGHAAVSAGREEFRK